MSSLADLTDKRTDFKKGKIDSRVDQIGDRVTNSKKLSPAISELNKQIMRYNSTLQALSAAGLGIVDSLNKIADLEDGELSTAVRSIAGVQKNLEEAREKIAKTIESALIEKVYGALNDDHKEVLSFEKNFQKNRAANLTKIDKLSGKVKKADKKKKKDTEKINSGLKSLEEAILEHDSYLGESFLTIQKLHRKRFADFIFGWLDVLQSEGALCNNGMIEIEDNTEKIREIVKEYGGEVKATPNINKISISKQSKKKSSESDDSESENKKDISLDNNSESEASEAKEPLHNSANGNNWGANTTKPAAKKNRTCPCI